MSDYIHLKKIVIVFVQTQEAAILWAGFRGLLGSYALTTLTYQTVLLLIVRRVWDLEKKGFY